MTAGPQNSGDTAERQGSLSRSLWHRFVRWDLASVSIALALICGVLLVLVPAFRSAYNLRALGFTIAVTGVVALAQVCVLSVGQFNLALTAMGAMIGLLTGWMMQDLGLAYPLAIALGIAFGCLTGGLQGAIIVRTEIGRAHV